ncbi:hypothetical protein GCM10023347_38550 [Streptomyces chumphonensis]|uniref:Uncharacterized protein n=1 Tax=Streptomyces chumphonensis TaxID=1214925 RepID=A0A927EWD7_9ACTN|nr:hypothetical protein [Streptomyces chumphonensis]MBD3930620.1 hypothetical protein [Streptomyces chumphonensis]
MRPQRFEALVLDLAKNDPRVGTVTTLKEAGDDRYPYGLAVRVDGREMRFQFIAQSRDGDKFTEPERVTEAEQPFDVDRVPAGGLPEERFIAELVARSGSRELVDVVIWSSRPDNRDGNEGASFFFADTARIYARVVR